MSCHVYVSRHGGNFDQLPRLSRKYPDRYTIPVMMKNTIQIVEKLVSNSESQCGFRHPEMSSVVPTCRQLSHMIDTPDIIILSIFKNDRNSVSSY